ncbi:RNA-directed DNA polymerase from mobile element jockey [Araneus ventricosus]|uniref:RNA-directed DNA polymerase from mobile element jockey n=1 Tax=Araneus ventricosus TaxID=182803 RepID=A0A4Y2M6Z3_ARAVE|nr:RNA-directed DNA polymerase from mobile element jockey [Araneus ventricosus]
MKEFSDALSKTSNRSPGPDKITKRMITSLSDANLYKVLGLFNDLWYSSSVPVDWRLAKFIPILKPGRKPEDVSSYRLIALTSVLCKLFERIILARLLKFYMHNKFFPPFQAGFLPYKGCDSLSSVLLNKMLTARARRNLVYGISFDIQGAYDNVWHDGLLFKLLQSGNRGRIALWFYHFLRDRKAFVSLRGTSSAFFRHDRGVPQGSVLFPIMFFRVYARYFGGDT